ncbi:AI-2E family transporter [Gluconobacter wancherniae]|uniref:AI-2E family transporter n=2 Tax=Gluconobacter wancherniae TaxID=1307955 RepID=A0A511B263_9PROT|nr:AI-2E family transporter [Gluconobacter wancherniae]GBD57590.1 AI-2E family transporter [Gluconobacter wancherniae NBRC 103581]MBS1063763.1 AI-2E family transporter [Gluconobacter wancherniae]MBS1095316.1 AI-2E family transporter [Gluconobacter wancherniae]GBR62139.1 transporter [Gluconobacter wancherniae NBRC 103581]
MAGSAPDDPRDSAYSGRFMPDMNTAKRESGLADDEPIPDPRLDRDILRQHMNVRDICVLILTVLAVFYSLYFTSAIILPFVFALVLNLLMITPMRLLHHKLRLPRHLAAFLLIVVMFGIVGGIATTISVPAAAWLSKASQTLPALQSKLAVLHAPIDAVQNSYARLSAMFSGHHVHTSTALSGQIGSDSALSKLGSSVLAGTREVVSGFFTMLLMLFFLMTDGDTLLRRLVEIMPTFADKRRIVEMSSQIEQNVSLYLVTITLMNLLVGLANMVQCWATGMPNPLLWGVLAFLLNYIPIIGPLTGVVVYFIVGLFSFPSLLYALVPPSIYLLIHFLEGETITPMLLARRFTLNPVFVMGSLLFWDWMWGISGAFLSVPMLAVFKIVCDHIETLAPLGHVLGGPPRRRTLSTIAVQFQTDP